MIVFAFLADALLAHMNSDGRGIKSGMNTCTCNDQLQCTCGVDSFLQQGNDVPGTTRKERMGAGKLRDRGNEIVLGARKGQSSFSPFSLP